MKIWIVPCSQAGSRAHQVRELDALVVPELHCAVVGDRGVVDLQDDVAVLEDLRSWRQRVDLVNQASARVWIHLVPGGRW